MFLSPTIKRWLIFLIIILIILSCWIYYSCFYKRYMRTADTMSNTYARCASSLYRTDESSFYVKDNVLYFAVPSNNYYTIRQIKNNVISTYARFDRKYDRFAIIDDNSVIGQRVGYNFTEKSYEYRIYLLNASDGTSVKEWDGRLVDYYDDQVYFVNDCTLYSVKISDNVTHPIISFDELLEVYNDAIIYKSNGSIYQLYLNQLDSPQLLVNSDIPWPSRRDGILMSIRYLYTDNYALQISIDALDIFFYESGEMKCIFSAEISTSDMIAMSVCANGNTLYISRQLQEDFSLPQTKHDKNINGIYKYDIAGDSWQKISSKPNNVLYQCDDQYLYVDPEWYYRGRLIRYSLD